MDKIRRYGAFLSSIDEVIEDARNGKMFVLFDDEDRENEGDLIIPAQMCTPEVVNFMAKFGRGLICLALPPERSRQLDLELMAQHNESRHQTAFTVSIEAREGITTGISAHDRAHTISVAIDPTRSGKDIVSPGHVFPLVARDGGVLVRTGHTEAAVDIARLAGLYPAGVICEIMNDDGTMAKLDDLVQFAQLHGVKLATIADLIAYRRRHDSIMQRSVETTLDSEYGGRFDLRMYTNTVEYAEHIALVKGDVADGEPVLVRMHAVNMFDDVMAMKGGRSHLIGESMRLISEEERGVIVFIRDTSATVLSDVLLHRRSGGDGGEPLLLREYGVGAQILLDLGVRDIILLSNTKRDIVGLEGYGLRIVEQRPVGNRKEAANKKDSRKETANSKAANKKVAGKKTENKKVAGKKAARKK
ncbi:MAG: 3,4-dihydroxy-2-butanone-4-phosphate synthase [Parvularculales bacterium]